MDEELRREVRRLRRTTTAAICLLVLVSASAFMQRRTPATFDEIDVQRINVREPDGKLRLTISNHARLPEVVVGGKSYPLRGGTGVQSAGLIFFNDEGTENGGLTFTGKRGPDGKVTASTHMSFDQFDQDQVLNLDYADNNGQRRIGMSIDERADVNIYDWVLQRDSIRQISDSAARAAAMARLVAPRNGVQIGRAHV